ncbi:MAG TPA: peptidyl-prolyl cis-trans isomerase [Burkholderiales bacterium]|nr:peptidyl-prolyl cis-trans isomerase [Burkholderiales bacterium]
MDSAVLRAGVLAACLAPAVAAAQDVATLGDVKITADEVKQLAKMQPQVKQQILGSEKSLESLVQQELVRRALFEEAAAQGWDKRPEVAGAAEIARERVILTAYLDGLARVPDGYPDEAAIKAFYDANKALITIPPRYRLAQIFVARPAAAGDVDAALKRAADLARRARANGADFAALAKAESADPASRDKGGELGWYAEGNLLPELRATVHSMVPGEISNPVASSAGWHVLRLLETKPMQAATLEEARDAVIQRLRAAKIAELKQEHIDGLLKKTPPKIDSSALSALRDSLK